MTHAVFYLDTPSPSATRLDSSLLQFVGELTAQHYQQGHRVYLLTDEQCQAEQLDEALWQRHPDDFIPHNLHNEGLPQGAPVEIGWHQQRHHGQRQILINLSQHAPNFAVTFSQVIDFVPCDEPLKQVARERYKAYRLMGIQITTASVPESP